MNEFFFVRNSQKKNILEQWMREIEKFQFGDPVAKSNGGCVDG